MLDATLASSAIGTGLVDWQLITGIVAGVGLAAAAGFRVFVPLLALAVAGRLGILDLSDQFAWLASTPALVMLATATVAEISAFYVPWVDNALDALAAPGSVLAGTVAVAAQAGSLDPWMQWMLGLFAGGGSALAVQASTMLLRGLSTIATGGLANPVLATGENLLALTLAVLAVVVPVLALCAAIAVVVLVVVWWQRRRTRQGMKLAVA